MTKAVTDILRNRRAVIFSDIPKVEYAAQQLELEAAKLREDAKRLRDLHEQLADAIETLEGPDAPLDHPKPIGLTGISGIFLDGMSKDPLGA